MSIFEFFDDIRCINADADMRNWEKLQQLFDVLGIAARVQRFPAIATPGNPVIGKILSHRRCIEEAQTKASRALLILEDDVLFLDRTLSVLAAAFPELQEKTWQLCYLGGCSADGELPPAPGCSHLRTARHLLGTYALAYSERAFATLLQGVPTEVGAMEPWLNRYRDFEEYLHEFESAYLVTPTVATTPRFLPYEQPADQFRFTL